MERAGFILGFFFIVVGIPVLAAAGAAIYSRWLQHRPLQLLLEERKLLIEKGVTDLPPLELPDPPVAPKPRGPLRNLKAGIILLFISAALVFLRISEIGGVHSGLPILAVMLAAIGLALLLIHAISSHYERREAQEQGPSGEENASVIEVDIEE